MQNDTQKDTMISFIICGLDASKATCTCRHEDPFKNQPVALCESETKPTDIGESRAFVERCSYRTVMTIAIGTQPSNGQASLPAAERKE
jgi:hypothetical protein